MKAFKLLLIFISLLFIQCEFYQNLPRTDYDASTPYISNNPSYPPKAEPGKCYAKCMIADQYETHSNEYPIYTGDDSEDVDLTFIEIEVDPATTKWERKIKDRDCAFADPNDCMVWRLVEVPAKIVELKVVKDITQTENYRLEKITQKQLTKTGGFTEWREVLCPADVNSVLVGEVQNSLRTKGYYQGTNQSILSAEVKAALVKFQKENGLPIGNLDFETLDALEIAWN